jgi:endonuclease YncB( thermonuclease family)
MKKLLFVFLILSTCLSAQVKMSLDSNEIYPVKKGWDTCVVKSVHDGDGFKAKSLWYVGEMMSIRFLGVDAPEIYKGGKSRTQPFGREAGDSLRAWIKLDSIRFQVIAGDAYERGLCNARTMSGDDLAYKILINGLGWYNGENLNRKQRKILRGAYKYAKDNRLGLWAGTWFVDQYGVKKWIEPVEPKVWRAMYN